MPSRTPKKRSSRRRSSKKQQPVLKGFLMLLVVIISLTIIALAATYVYVRLNKKPTSSEVMERNVPEIADTAVIPIAPQPTPIKSETRIKTAFEPGLSGTWVSNSSSAMITFEGETYTLDLPSVEDIPVIKGAFTLYNGTLTLKTAEGPQPCIKTTGRYNYSLKNDQLTLRLQSDDCKTRSRQLNTSFFRLSGKF